jgi:hypothetical protein
LLERGLHAGLDRSLYKQAAQVSASAQEMRGDGQLLPAKNRLLMYLRAKRDRPRPPRSRKKTFKPMKFLRNGHVRPIALDADIDIARACFSLK